MSQVMEITDNVLTQREDVEYKQNFGISRLFLANPKQIIPELKLRSGMKILDIGCNTGKLLFGINDLLSQCELKGLDVNSKAIETATKKIGPDENIEFMIYTLREKAWSIQNGCLLCDLITAGAASGRDAEMSV